MLQTKQVEVENLKITAYKSLAARVLDKLRPSSQPRAWMYKCRFEYFFFVLKKVVQSLGLSLLSREQARRRTQSYFSRAIESASIWPTTGSTLYSRHQLNFRGLTSSIVVAAPVSRPTKRQRGPAGENINLENLKNSTSCQFRSRSLHLFKRKSSVGSHSGSYLDKTHLQASVLDSCPNVQTMNCCYLGVLLFGVVFYLFTFAKKMPKILNERD